ncbi:carboxypeptidase-like regulatory domain-containing protein [Cohnella cholangitidis]|uniref:carboxypeptidase-like regulatory domain-containing protein n=1 Tax=Cohnella cholangitidis TaxID=2598458 RepID=UPI0015F7B58E|nr:carboxypeptidase-like regulatory domain-containing protein [Cohnella cholangitidis]
MKVTFKVKHLVLGVLAAGAIVLLLQYVVIPKLQVHYAVKGYEDGNPGGKDSLLTAIDESASSGKKWELIREYMIGDSMSSPAHSFDVFVGSGWTQSSPLDKESRLWSWEDKLPYLKAYLAEGPADHYLVRAAKQIADYYISEDKAREALEALESVEKRLSGDYSNQARELKLERAKIHANREEWTEAERLLDDLERTRSSGNIDFNGDIVQLRAQLMIRRGDVRSALDKVSGELAELRKWIKEEKKKFPDMGDFTPAKLEELTSLKARLEHSLEQRVNGMRSSTVSGVVRKSDGTPMARVGVFLRSEQDVNHSITEGEPYQLLTDAQGHYEFKGVLPGSYQLFIGLLYEQIDGWTWPTMNDDWIDVKEDQSLAENIVLRPLIEIKSPINQKTMTGSAVKFQWEPVEGAATYKLYGTWPSKSGTTNALIEENIGDSRAELPVDVLYDAAGGIYMNEVDGQFVLDPAQLLGFANPEARFSWYVEAYDQEGRLLTRSNGYRLNEDSMGALPFFYLKSRTLTDEDRIFLDGNMEEALIAYKKAFENDRQDRHSLRMIIRIYEGQASINGQRTLSDESVPYLERMAELAPSGYVYKLFDYYYEKKNWEKVDYYYGMMAQEEGWSNSYVQSVYGTALMKQRRIAEAAAQLREGISKDPSHRFVGHCLAVDIYSTGSLDSAARLADKYPERSPFEQGTPNWSKLVRELRQESRTVGASYAEEMKQALGLYFDGDSSGLDKWLSSTERTAMKAFVKALETVN